MKKVMTIVGTRPEIIKLSRVLAQLEKHTDHTLVHTGQNYDYELNQVFFDELQIKKPDYFLEAAGESAVQTIGNVIAKADHVLDEIQPDCVLLYGDTNSCLAVIPAKRRKIPVFHMEAGNRCFDERVPEEINRRIVDHLSDVNMTLTEHARRYLIREGIRAETIIKTGSSMPEVLSHYQQQISTSRVLERLNLTERKFFVVSAHREENVDSKKNFSHLLDSLNGIAQKYDCPVIVSTHPRTRKKLMSLVDLEINPHISFLKPMGFFDYIRLQASAWCTVSDSGTITEESSILGFPAIMIRQAHERPEGMDAGTLVMSGLKRQNVLDAIRIVTSQFTEKGPAAPVSDYESDRVSCKVIRIILSYTDYVKRTVWREY